MRHILAFIWKHNFFFLFLVLEVLSITLLVNKSYYQRAVLTNMTDNFSGSVNSMYADITNYFSLREENERLATENAQLWQRLKAGKLTTDTASYSLEDTLHRQTYTYTVAKVVSNSSNNRDNYLMLNKGKRHGITPDMAVICPDGIVGTVVSVSENFCWVMSALNKHSKFSARIERLQQMGTVVWSGSDPAKGNLTDIPVHVKVQKGDTIRTSGYSYIFPESIMVGIVEEMDIEEGEHFHNIQFRWSTDFNGLIYVYIVNNLYREEQIDLNKEVIDE